MLRNPNYQGNHISCLFFLFLWPFFGWIYSLYASHSKKIKLFSTAYFSAVLGYNVLCYNVTSDSAKYAGYFQDARVFGFDFAANFLTGKFDVFAPLSYLAIGRVTSNPHILFAFWTCIFGVLLYKSISLFSNFTGNKMRYSIVMILLYFVCSHFNVVTARFYIAFWYFICMFSYYLYCKNNRYFVLLMLTPLIHTAFLILLPLVFIERFVKINVNISLLIMIACVYIGEFTPIGEQLNRIGMINENEHYSMYVENDYVNESQAIGTKMSMAHIFLNYLARISTLFIIFYAKRFYNRLVDSRMSSFYDKFYIFTILLYSFSSLVCKVTSLGRFMSLSHYFAIAVALLCLTQIKLKYSSNYVLLLLISYSGIIIMACINLYSRFTLNGYFPIIYFINEDL